MAEKSERYQVVVRRKLMRVRLPKNVADRFVALVSDLKARGPIQPSWPNYSPLGPGRFHCHLNRNWVACWKHERNTILIEVYYVGSRQGAPY